MLVHQLPYRCGDPDGAMKDMLRRFPLQARKALYTATTRPLKRKTWNGCALNMAGVCMGLQVWSVPEAARAFDIQESVARRFLQLWDSAQGSDAVVTWRLRQVLEEIGFEPEPKAVVAPEVKSRPLDFELVRRILEATRPLPEIELEPVERVLIDA